MLSNFKAETMRNAPENVVQQWLDALSSTTIAGELDRHMALISQKLKLFGMPGFDTLGYDDWKRQCAHEFPQRMVDDIHYGPVKIRTTSDGHILFSVHEYIETRDGERIKQPVEMLLSLEDDGQWRLTQQRILDAAEATHLGLE